MDTYSHVLPGLDEHAAVTVADLILNGPAAKKAAPPAAEDGSADRPDPASGPAIDRTVTNDEDAA